MAEVYAEFEDVRDAWNRPLPEARREYVERKLGEAHRLLRSPSNAPGLDLRVTSGQLDRELVGDIIVRMVIRVLRNPEGYRTESDGDYSYGRESGSSSGEVTVTDKDLEDLGFSSTTTYATPGPGAELGRAWRRDPYPRRHRGPSPRRHW